MLVSSVPLSETHSSGLLRSAMKPGQRGVGRQAQAFAREVVDHSEDAEAAAVAQCVAEKIERPALVRSLRHGQRCPGAERPLAAAATLDLEALLGIEPPQLLVVHVQSFPAK
jgi:hypothetical protein